MADDVTHRPPRTYHASDIEIVLKRGNWQSWDEAVHWLQGAGMRDTELPPAEGSHIAEDFKRLTEEGAAYTNDPEAAYELARRSCCH